MSFQPIENYGVIGNMRSIALVGMNGSIDFREAPGIRQSSWAVFRGAGRERATSWELPPGLNAPGADQRGNLSGPGPLGDPGGGMAVDWPNISAAVSA